MADFKMIAFVLVIAALVGTCAPLQGQAGNSSAISDATANLPVDHSFDGYERVKAGIIPPKATKSPDPPYPDLPPDTEPRGLVVMLIGVDTRGHVGPVHVVRSSAPVFEKSAVSTVKTWRFKPAKKDGKAVPVQITVEMSFSR